MHDTPRSAFPHFCEIATRWMDNDVYGHVNNIHYYSYFDTAVNRFLIERGGHFVHVYVDRESKRPVAIPEGTRALLAGLEARCGDGGDLG